MPRGDPRQLVVLESSPDSAPVCVSSAVSTEGNVIEIRTRANAAEAALALQVRAGTSLCELGPIDGSVNQQWRQEGEALQHVGTGLWLDSESKYCHHLRGAPWESCA